MRSKNADDNNENKSPDGNPAPPPEFHFCIKPIKLPCGSVRLDMQLHFLAYGLPLREEPVRRSFSCVSGFSLVYQTAFNFQKRYIPQQVGRDSRIRNRK